MKRSACLLFVAASVAVLFCPAIAASRPRYGETLRVELSGSLNSLDPAQQSGSDSITREEVATLIFDRLVDVDQQKITRPALAASWQHEPDYRRWLFHLQSGVVLHNGAPLRPHLVVMSLAASNPSWLVRLQADDVVIESSSPVPNLLS